MIIILSICNKNLHKFTTPYNKYNVNINGYSISCTYIAEYNTICAHVTTFGRNTNQTNTSFYKHNYDFQFCYTMSISR